MKAEEVEEIRERRFSSIKAEIDEMWQTATLLSTFSSAWHSCHSPISGKLNGLTVNWPAWREGLVECVCVKWIGLYADGLSASLLPQSVPLLQAPSSPFDMVMGPNWWRHFTHSVTTLLASDINTSSTPPHPSLMKTLPSACLALAGREVVQSANLLFFGHC